MGTVSSAISWSHFEARAPRLAVLGSERFERTRVAILGTVRADGSPRISPIEPVLANGRLLLGAMPSLKRGDLERDPRCALHSSISDVNGSEGEFKIHGRAILAGDEIRDAEYEAWWKSFPRESAAVFDVDIRSAVFVGWDTSNSELRVMRWTPQDGVTEHRRPYP